MYRIVPAYLSSRARYNFTPFFYTRVEKSDLRHFFRNSFDTFFLSLYTYMIHDVTNFKGNKFITNVLISLRINFFWKTEKSEVKTNE